MNTAYATLFEPARTSM